MHKSPKVVAINAGAEEAAFRKLVDEFWELKRQEMEICDPISRKLDKLRQTILAKYDNWPPDQPAIAAGDFYTVQISERAEKRELDTPGLFKALGKFAFLKLCRFPLEVFDRLSLDSDLLASLVTKSRTGNRTVKAALRSPIVEAA